MVKPTHPKSKRPASKTINETLKRHAQDLQYLNGANGNVQKAIIKEGKPSLVRVLVLLAGNILNGVVQLTPQQKKQLGKYASVIRKLVDGPRTTSARKHLVARHTNQQGGFLSFLINPIAKLIGALVK